MTTPTLQMKKQKPTGATMALGFKDHALKSLRDVPYSLLSQGWE